MFSGFLMKQMLSRQLANVPEEQKQKILAAFEKNPDFFKELAATVQNRVQNGESQMNAIMAVVAEKKSELESMLKG